MVNGNLEEWLHPVQTSDEANGPKALDLMHRLNIAIHMASALNYLHHDCQMPIIHCDLKPSNILLDTNMTAHVGDFGLARFHSEASNQTNSVGLKGTIGYAAPGNIHSFSLFTGCEISFLRDRFN
jgi:serine/threonine protein kinase